MDWPSPTDYQDVIQNPRICFQDVDLKMGNVAVDKLGLPRPASGGFATVYELRNGGQRLAVRCFNRQVSDQQSRYAQLSQFLSRIRLPYLVMFKYLEQGIKVRGHWYPIVTMEWVEGEALNKYIERHINNKMHIHGLAEQWRGMVNSLLKNGIAHGDLQHGNVLVTPNGQIRLVDYDAMFIPAFQGKPSPELGLRNYQHPKRKSSDYNAALDNFAALIIYISLRAVAVNASLWQGFHTGENLILSAKDFESSTTSALMQRLRQSQDKDVGKLAMRLEQCCSQMVSQIPSLETILADLPTMSTPQHVVTTPLPARSAYMIPTSLSPSTQIPDWLNNPPQTVPSSRANKTASSSTSSISKGFNKKTKQLTYTSTGIAAGISVLYLIYEINALHLSTWTILGLIASLVCCGYGLQKLKHADKEGYWSVGLGGVILFFTSQLFFVILITVPLTWAISKLVFDRYSTKPYLAGVIPISLSLVVWVGHGFLTDALRFRSFKSKPAVQLQPPISLPTGTIIPSEGARIRSGPSRNMAVLGTLGKGDVVNILSREGEWHKVQYYANGQIRIGYLHISVVSVYGSPTNVVGSERPTIIPTTQPEAQEPMTSIPVKTEAELVAITINSTPSGATVYTAGQRGQTPYAFQVKPGSNPILLKHPGYKDYREAVIVDVDGKRSFDFTLEPKYNVVGIWKGTFGDKPLSIIIESFDGSQVTGHSKLQWTFDSVNETPFVGTFSLSEGAIMLEEQGTGFGVGKFVGTISNDGKFLKGTWTRLKNSTQTYNWSVSFLSTSLSTSSFSSKSSSETNQTTGNVGLRLPDPQLPQSPQKSFGAGSSKQANFPESNTPSAGIAPYGVTEKFTISIDSSPSEATVYIDGKKEGYTPISVTIQPGIYVIWLEKAGYTTHKEMLNIKAFDSRNFYFQLKASPSSGRNK